MIPKISIILITARKVIDGIGMYRVVSGTLSLLALISVLAGGVGWLAYSAFDQAVALCSAVFLALGLNFLCAKLLSVAANHESALITALILFFLFIPGSDFLGNQSLWLAVLFAITSKFFITYRKQHVVNPAAFGAIVPGLIGLYPATWWVGNPTLFVPLLVAVLLVVLKVRKWALVTSFVGAGLFVYLAESVWYQIELWGSAMTFFISWPTLFLATFMLTEPFTMPSRRRSQLLYGVTVGAISNTSIFSGLVAVTPELTLVFANLLFLPLRLKQKLFLKLIEKRQLAQDTYEFIFKKPAGFEYAAGQYLEWSLPHAHPDSRGERRYFTIASAPTEEFVRLACKVIEGGSSYKRALSRLVMGDVLIASQLAGDFVLPDSKEAKLGFMAGGIGVTPFRSHIQYMVDSGVKHDTKLLYCVNGITELAYEPEFTRAATIVPLEVIPVVSKEVVDMPLERGYVTLDLLKRRVPDYRERVWYISGPPPMVGAYGKLLKSAGVPGKQIKKDFFPGLA